MLLNDLVSLWWTPGILRIFRDRSHVVQNRIYYSPSGLYGVFSHEECFFAPHGIRQESLIWRHLIGGLMHRVKLDLFSLHGFSWNLGPSTNRNPYDWTDAEDEMI